jgi:hypothetical protein
MEMNEMNIEHSTFNAQRGKLFHAVVTWMFDVEC